MPGGSGLLEQACERWEEVAQALVIADHCPSGCIQSCGDCLQIFRNAYYHRYLERRKASERLREWGSVLKLQHEIPPKMPDAPPEKGKEKARGARDDPSRFSEGYRPALEGRLVRDDGKVGATPA